MIAAGEDCREVTQRAVAEVEMGWVRVGAEKVPKGLCGTARESV